MWLLHLLPDSFIQFIVHTILVAGIVGTFLSFYVVNKILMAFPFLSRYVTIAQLVSAILLIGGVYFEGGYSTEMLWRNRVREVEAQVAKAEQEAKEANEKLDKKAAEQVKMIQVRQVVVKEYIDREVAKYNEMCSIPDVFVSAHNQSAEQPK